ncbi:glutamate receptor 2.7-like isoform X1 [Tasmannia lanceolata]|uniref:glutamate receptor 2.7-like isoform X1 n=1 Tax=Tasmannia lanceolata TaxID=3420 RepID=UPI004063E419
MHSQRTKTHHFVLCFLPSRSSKSLPIFFFIFSCLLFFSHGGTAENIGAIIDTETRIGKEQKIAMEIAIQDFNNTSNISKLSLHIRDSSGDPLRAVSAAEDLISELKIKAIVGITAWQEAILIANVGNREQIPVISFSAPAISPPMMLERWPFLVLMSNNYSAEMSCIASLVRSYGWRKIITIYEENSYSGGDDGTITLLSETLKNVESEIEYHSTLPPLSSLSDPKTIIREELTKLKKKQSRVFVVLKSSSPFSEFLFEEAKQMGMMEKGYVWITTESITNLIDSFNSSVISTMQGVLGIKTHFSETSSSFKDFSIKFQKNFRSEYPGEKNPEPGMFALVAYDAIWAVARAMEKNSKGGKGLVEGILTSDWKGLSGKIRFVDGELANNAIFQIINVVGKSYKELGFWSPVSGFVKNTTENERGEKEEILGPVFWPGDSTSVPLGWAIPTDEKQMRIGVPNKSQFNLFVKVDYDEKNVTKFSGFSIKVFEEAVKLLPYNLPYVFEQFGGSYDDLVNEVYLEHFEAVVGDVTILAARSEYVEFTQPYAESGLAMLVPVKEASQKAWLFVKPFTKEMWAVTGVIFVYTGLVVWFLEHRRNPDFRGPWGTQLSTMLWFIFCTLFFAHRERLRSNFTRVVIVMWLFVVLVLTSSYTASLTSMLTVQRLEPKVNDIEFLRRNHLPVGCDNDSFVEKYLTEVLHFDQSSIVRLNYLEEDYSDAFNSGRIVAAFLEIPYLRIFLSKYCKGYTTLEPSYSLGGFGFVFPKGSPLTSDMSKAILTLSENGRLRELEDQMMSGYTKCSGSGTNLSDKNESLTLESFWLLFVLTGGISTLAVLIFLANLLRKLRQGRVGEEEYISPGTKRLWRRAVTLVKYWNKGQLSDSASRSSSSTDTKRWSSTRMRQVSLKNTPQHPEDSPC